MSTIRLFHPQHTALRLAVVSVQPAADGRVHVVVARGASRHALTDSAMYGPFAASEAVVRCDDIVEGLRRDGYLPGGVAAMVDTVRSSKSPKARAHAAERLGWRRERAAVSALVERAQQPKDDVTSVVTALGRIGMASEAAVDVVRAEAARKLLSRRRAGAEALRLLGNTPGVTEGQARARERLVDVGVMASSSAAELVLRLASLPKKDQGPAAEALYDLGTDVAVEAVQRHLETAPLTQPGFWRFAKSILKRAMVRHDGATFGLLMARIERLGRTAKGGTVSSLKSGLDGESRPTRVFSQRTADWLRRAAWRHLTRVARYRPEDFTRLATDVLLQARNSDDVAPRHRVPASGHCYLVMRIVHAGGARFEVDHRRPIHRLIKGKPPQSEAREEAFPELWATAAADVDVRRLLAFAEHRLVIAMALRLVALRPAIIDDADTTALVAMLRLPALATRIEPLLRRRLRQPPLDVNALIALAALGDAGSDDARVLVGTVISDSAHLWLHDAAVCIQLLLAPSAVAEVAARLLRVGAPSLTATERGDLVARVLSTIEAPEPREGAFDAVAEVIDVLADDVAAACDIERARKLLAMHPVGAAVAAIVIGRRDDAVDLLGIPEVLRLAGHSIAAWRSVVTTMLTWSAGAFAARPGLLLELLEGEWDDVRVAGLHALNGMEATLLRPGKPDTDAVIAVCDSTWPAVQAVGQRFVRGLVAAGEDTGPLVIRLAQHPHAAMRAFVLDLAEGVVGPGLRPGFAPLLRLEPLLRAALFDVRPSHALRRRVVTLLARRGVVDEAQGELAATILRDVVRSRTHGLRDDALAALVSLADRWPEVRRLLTTDGIVVDDAAVGAP